MARAGGMLWAFSLLIVSANLADAIGVNWGTQASHTLHPRIVAGLLKDNGFTKLKLFDADAWAVSYFAGTGIEVMLAIPNMALQDMNKYSNAKDWVKANVTRHMHDGGVDIKYVAVGNEAFLKAYNGSFLKTTLPAMQNVQKALNEAGHSQVKVVTPLNADVYDSGSNKPSDGAFRPDIKETMNDIVHFLKDNDAPFVVNIYPFLSLYANSDFPFDFAFFDGGSKPVTDKGGLTYKNVFDANYDTLVWALKKAGAPDLKILVGEIGWPTDGDKNANIKLAKRFYDGFFKKMASSEKGTPLRPKENPEVYLFGLTDEDAKSVAPGDFERHWGIFRYDGVPKFAMDLAGNGHEKMPQAAKGVHYQSKQWCVFNKNANKDGKNLDAQIEYACSKADCTSLGQGSSCGSLDTAGNFSYGFNMYYQTMDQGQPACDFDGFGMVVKNDPSQKGCLFPIQIVQDDAHSLRNGFTTVGFLLLVLLALF